jgi:hypothetical protein
VTRQLGPQAGLNEGCYCVDLEQEGDVDLADFRLFQTPITVGPPQGSVQSRWRNLIPTPACRKDGARTSDPSPTVEKGGSPCPQRCWLTRASTA